jgi:hypothetical protein
MAIVKLIDEMTLRSIVDKGYGLSFECDNCWQLVAVDLLELIARFGVSATMATYAGSLYADGATSGVHELS